MFQRTAKESKYAVMINSYGGAVMASDWNNGYIKYPIPAFCKELLREDISEDILNKLHKTIKVKIQKILTTTKAKKVIFISDFEEAQFSGIEESQRNLDKYIKTMDNLYITSRVITDFGLFLGSSRSKRPSDHLSERDWEIFLAEYDLRKG